MEAVRGTQPAIHGGCLDTSPSPRRQAPVRRLPSATARRGIGAVPRREGEPHALLEVSTRLGVGGRSRPGSGGGPTRSAQRCRRPVVDHHRCHRGRTYFLRRYARIELLYNRHAERECPAPRTEPESVNQPSAPDRPLGSPPAHPAEQDYVMAGEGTTPHCGYAT